MKNRKRVQGYGQSRSLKHKKHKKQVLHQVDYLQLAKAVHLAVCSVTGDDGFGWCLDYAIMGALWLTAKTSVPHEVVGGKFEAYFGDNTYAFEHFWIKRSDGKVLDLSTRHNAAILRTKVDTVEDDVFAKPFHLGSDRDKRWRYIILSDANRLAQRTFRQLKGSATRLVRWVDSHMERLHDPTEGRF